MKPINVKAGQRRFLFERGPVWQQLPSPTRTKVVSLLAEMIRDFHFRRRRDADN